MVWPQRFVSPKRVSSVVSWRKSVSFLHGARDAARLYKAASLHAALAAQPIGFLQPTSSANAGTVAPF